MAREYQRPILQPSAQFDWIIGFDGPEVTHRLAQETAWALLHRVRGDADPATVERVVELAAGPHLTDIAEMWASESPRTLAGVLWRLYLLRRAVASSADEHALMYRLGVGVAVTIDPVVAGVADPATPQGIAGLCDTILRGVFAGDFGDALHRASSYSRVMSLGAAELADRRDGFDQDHAAHLTRRSLRYGSFASELHAAAVLWSDGSLE